MDKEIENILKKRTQDAVAGFSPSQKRKESPEERAKREAAKKDAFDRIKRVIGMKMRNFLKKNPELAAKIKPEEFIDIVANSLVHKKGFEDDNYSPFDIFQEIATKKQKGANDTVSEDVAEKLKDYAYNVACGIRKQILGDFDSKAKPNPEEEDLKKQLQ